jgi:hypothetical protein
VILDPSNYSDYRKGQHNSADRKVKNETLLNGQFFDREAYAGRQRVAFEAGVDRASAMVLAKAK